MDDMPDTPQRAVIAFLSSPAAHGGAVPERIDTHLSHLFLGPQEVLKLKRAVRLDFVDYGSVDARRAYCEREIAVNDWASALYHGVAPVWQAGGRWGVGPPPEGAAVRDHVVRMARFADNSRADRLLAAGRLDRALVEGFADDLAARHAAASSRDVDGAASLARRCGQIGHDLAHALGAEDAGGRARVAAWRSAAEQALAGARDLAAARADAGCIRPCHGDLHLENVVLLDGRLVAFDALEFGEAFATTDTLFDLAFPVMDLLAHDAPALASDLMNRYLARSDAYDGLGLVRLFLSLRAGVRAMAAALSGDGERLERYLALAEALALPPLPPRLVAIGGRSGTGKSTLARAVAPGLGPVPGAVILRSDVLRKQLAGAAPEDRLPETAYSEAATARLCETLSARARATLRAGWTCVLDATFLSPAAQALVDDVQAATGVPLTRLWLDAPPGTLRRRIAGRGRDASDAGEAVLERQLGQPAPSSWPVVDVSGTPGEAAGALRRALSGTPGPD